MSLLLLFVFWSSFGKSDMMFASTVSSIVSYSIRSRSKFGRFSFTSLMFGVIAVDVGAVLVFLLLPAVGFLGNIAFDKESNISFFLLSGHLVAYSLIVDSLL